MNYYLATAMNAKNEIMQLCIELSPADSRFNDPIKCCTNAASTNFWRSYLKAEGVNRMMSIKPVCDLVNYRGVS